MNFMRKFFISISLIILGCAAMAAQSNLTPVQILEKAVAPITAAKGVDAQFQVSNSGYTGKGQIKTSGNKFTVQLPDAMVWYNGCDLYTYNERTGETTIVTPTADELVESNPLNYVSGASKQYNVAFSTVKKTGKYVLELTPKTKGGYVKRVTLTVDKTSFKPEKIVVEPSSGAPLAADISSFKTGVTVPAADFEYPKAKYPKAEIVDLR